MLPSVPGFIGQVSLPCTLSRSDMMALARDRTQVQHLFTMFLGPHVSLCYREMSRGVAGCVLHGVRRRGVLQRRGLHHAEALRQVEAHVVADRLARQTQPHLSCRAACIIPACTSPFHAPVIQKISRN